MISLAVDDRDSQEQIDADFHNLGANAVVWREIRRLKIDGAKEEFNPPGLRTLTLPTRRDVDRVLYRLRMTPADDAAAYGVGGGPYGELILLRWVKV